MTQQWAEEFASILAERLGEAVTELHRDVGEYWAEEADIMTPAEAVDEEISCWGD